MKKIDRNKQEKFDEAIDASYKTVKQLTAEPRQFRLSIILSSHITGDLYQILVALTSENQMKLRSQCTKIQTRLNRLLTQNYLLRKWFKIIFTKRRSQVHKRC